MSYSENESTIHCQNCGGNYEAALTECPYCHASTEENLSQSAPKTVPTVAELGGGFGEPGSTIGRVAAAIVIALMLLSVVALAWSGRSLLTKGITVPTKPDSSAATSTEPEKEPEPETKPDASQQEEEAPKLPKSITLDTDSITLTEGETYQLVASVLPNDWEGELTWSSDNKKIASVSKKGKLTNVNGGDCTITVSAGDVTATCAVHCEGKTLEEKKAEEQKKKEEEKRKKEEAERKKKEEEERRKQEEEAAAAAQSSGGLTLTLGGKSYDDNDFTLVHVGESYTFEVNGGDGSYSASSSNSSVASVSGTKVTATGVGVATVTWKSGDGKSVSATIRVNSN